MKHSELDYIISILGKTLIEDEKSFEGLTKQVSSNLGVDDLTYLRSKFHDPPPEPSNVVEGDPLSGIWMAACQYAIFELIYQLDVMAIDLLESIAYGIYDWTQATALEVICRLYVDGKLLESAITKMDEGLGNMRNETHWYLGKALAIRRKKDSRFDDVLIRLKNIDFRLALAEIGCNQPLTREELIGLGKRIVAADGTEEEIQKIMELFDVNVPYPKGSNLFYWPENFNLLTGDTSEYNPTVEEVVDKCLSYKPINL